jgi:hypothetical protein
MMPGGGLLADAVAVELLNRGFTVIDGNATSNLMIRLNLNEVEIARPEGLAKFKGQGIDAVLVVRGAGGYDDQPQSASARMTSTMGGHLLAGTTLAITLSAQSLSWLCCCIDSRWRPRDCASRADLLHRHWEPVTLPGQFPGMARTAPLCRSLPQLRRPGRP